MSEYDRQRDIAAEGQRAAVFHSRAYACPMCASQMRERVLTTYPPIKQVYCEACGSVYQDTPPRSDLVPLPKSFRKLR